MAQYNSINVKLNNSHINKLKSAAKNTTGVTLRISLNMIGAKRAGTVDDTFFLAMTILFSYLLF